VNGIACRYVIYVKSVIQTNMPLSPSSII